MSTGSLQAKPTPLHSVSAAGAVRCEDGRLLAIRLRDALDDAGPRVRSHGTS
ncbi:hypothetical protein ACFY7H_19995 [Streptomyces sp. NPDC012794]|uniref:hypothetical protein n=1 Tax=Streptomyces sp. NPDC012794 TaxID=3364850 RepID=UPI0036B5871F